VTMVLPNEKLSRLDFGGVLWSDVRERIFTDLVSVTWAGLKTENAKKAHSAESTNADLRMWEQGLDRNVSNKSWPPQNLGFFATRQACPKLPATATRSRSSSMKDERTPARCQVGTKVSWGGGFEVYGLPAFCPRLHYYPSHAKPTHHGCSEESRRHNGIAPAWRLSNPNRLWNARR